MANTIVSPNMNLPVPVTGTDPGPDWADNLNACLNQIDAHNHTVGYGVQVPTGGLNINADLTFQSNNATNIRSSRYSIQGSPLSTASSSDVACVYVAGYDLYYNDVVGNQVRITSGGGIAGSPGSIANLTPPASAAYVSGNQTFVWQSAVNTPANMDFASAIFRNLSASSFGLTLSPPAGMGINTTVTLPAVPASNKILQMDNSGNILSNVDADGSTLQFTASTLSIKNAGVNTAQIASGAVLTGNIGSGTITLGVINSVSAFPSIKYQDFNTAGSFSFTAPNTTIITAFIVGGGGGGGGGVSGNSGAGGGGVGVIPIMGVFSVVPGDTYKVSVGPAGASGSAGAFGGNGGASLVTNSASALLIKCAGGNGGNPGVGTNGGAANSSRFAGNAFFIGSGAGGSGGVDGTSGDDSFYGRGGGIGTGSGGYSGGGGGGAGYGSGGTGAVGNNGSFGNNGAGFGTGGGGGGGAAGSGGGGGNGSPGFIRLIWTHWG